MHPRTKIPAIALLGLSCSECTERGPGDQASALAGEWEAIDIDGVKFPKVETEAPAGEGQVPTARRGWELHVGAEAGSTLAYFQEYSYSGSPRFRADLYSDLEIDDDAAPRYRLTIEGDLVHAQDEQSHTTVTTLEGGYDASGYSGTAGYDTGYADTGGSTGGLDEDELAFDEFERELVEASHPSFAGGMILDCELKAEQLHCTRQIGAGDDGKDKIWTFARVKDE